MSITGSLVGYENNNDVSHKKNQSLLNSTIGSTKQCSSLNSTINTATTVNTSISTGGRSYCIGECKSGSETRRFHLNSLWSVWYGILITLVQAYLVLSGVYRFLGCSMLNWSNGSPNLELNIQLILCGFVLIVLPLFFVSAVFKVGNFANDGVMLAAVNSDDCSTKPDNGLEADISGGTIKALWIHGGPTSAFTHIILAICLLLPRLLLEARLIQNDVLPNERIWSTDLDFLTGRNDRQVVLSFMTQPYQNVSTEASDLDYDLSVYRETHLVEKLNPDSGDHDISHENLELENDDTYTVPSTTITTTTSSTTVPPRTTATTTTAVTASRKLTKLFATQRPLLTNPPMKHVPKHERNRNHNRSNVHRNSGVSNRKYSTVKDAKDYSDTHQAVNTRGHNAGQSSSSSSSQLGRKRIEKHFRRNDPQISTDIEDPWDSFEMSTIPWNAERRTKKPIRHHGTRTNSAEERTKTPPAIRTTEAMPASTSKDSEIHIVKPDQRITDPKTSTPIANSNSKIIEIIPSTKNRTKTKATPKQSTAPQSVVEWETPDTFSGDDGDDSGNTMIEAMALMGVKPITVNKSTTPVSTTLTGIAGCLQKWLGIRAPMDMKTWSHPPSLEFINLVIAIMVWSIQYPAVFWGTSKAFTAVFSLQMTASGIVILLDFTGVSVLYKLQVLGQSQNVQVPTLLLNAVVTISLFLLSTILILASSLILYLYGHDRLSARIRDRHIISAKTADTWAYFSHCASTCFVIALIVVKAPLIHDLSATYNGYLDVAVMCSALGAVVHIFMWIFLWLGLAAKRRWHFKLPPIEKICSVAQPLLVSPHGGRRLHPSSHVVHSGSGDMNGSDMRDGSVDSGGGGGDHNMSHCEEQIYWPKLTPSSPKLKVTFNEVPSTSLDYETVEHDGKRYKSRRASVCMSGAPGETDDGDYATLRGPTAELHLDDHCATIDTVADDTSEEGKLLACVRDDSVTYASTRGLEPPHSSITARQEIFRGSVEQIISPIIPVKITVHTNEVHCPPASTATPRCLRRADSGVPNEALTPRSDTTSNESSTSPPDRAPSETSSGVHSGEERDEVVIRPRPSKSIAKPPQPPPITEEPFGRSTNMKMTSFNKDAALQCASATLPLTRTPSVIEPGGRYDYSHSTMPLPQGCHQSQSQYQSASSSLNSPHRPKVFTPPGTSCSKQTAHLLHTTLPNGVRYSNPQFLRRMPHVRNAESPYGHSGLGSGHHTFSKFIHEPQMLLGGGRHSLTNDVIPEDRDSANYSMVSEHDRVMYVNSVE